MNEQLTPDEEMIYDLALRYMQNRGEVFRVTFIVSHGFQSACAYLVMGRVVSPEGAHKGEHLLYMRFGKRFVLLPRMQIARVPDDSVQKRPRS